jgi:hypothetical protein
MARRLRIAASVFFAVLTVALCVLWVASNRGHLSIMGKIPGLYDFGIEVLHGSTGVHIFPGSTGWAVASQDDLIVTDQHGERITRPHIFFYRRIWFSQAHNFPLWVPILVSSALIIAPWCLYLPHRFSLRTMLIAATLVAVALGLGVYFAG